MPKIWLLRFVVFLFTAIIAAFPLRNTSIVSAATLSVPQQYSTIQAAVTAAQTGDIIKVSPGTYAAVTISKQITLEATTFDRVNPKNNTAKINGGVIVQNGNWAWDQGPVIRGFYITGTDPVVGNRTPYTAEYNYITAGSDGFSFNTGGGIIRGNFCEVTGDDCIDVDSQSVNILIENNTLKNAGQDGMEIRHQAITLSQRITLTFRNNRVEGSGQDGIQIMDYQNFTNRSYFVERNLFIGSGRSGSGAGIGIMPADVTQEDLSAGPMPEPLYAVNNTFVNNDAGISGGANLIAMNNIFSGNTVFDLKNVNGRSKVMNSLFATAAKLQGTNNLETATTKTGNPQFDAGYGLQAGSLAIDAGRPTYQHTYSFNSQSFTDTLSAGQFSGNAPDLGWKESGLTGPTTSIPTTPPGTNPTNTPGGGGGGSGSTLLNLTLFLHGIGRGGDNVNPTSTGNLSPAHPQRQVSVKLLDANNQPISAITGTVTYNSASGNFTGTVNGGTMNGGIYTGRVKITQYLGKTIPGILNISKGQTNTIPTLSLTTGDANNDNKLSVLDYNVIIDCNADSGLPKNCTDTTKKQMADLTDDNAVNMFDYNLFLREMSQQGGDGGGVTPGPTASVPTATRTPSGTQPTATRTPSSGPTPTRTPTSGPVPTSRPGTIVGYGRNTVGGTGGSVQNVTSLSALRSCIAGSGRRICKITGSGVWDGGGAKLEVNSPNITIDGEGSNVQFKDAWFHISTSEVIIRHIRARTGDLNVLAADADAISINGGTGAGIHNIVIDHVEAIWGPDVCFTILNNVSDITVQNSILGWGLGKSAHPEATQDADGHNLAFNLSGISGSTAWPKRVTVYRNLIGGAQGRYTRAMGAEATDIINNIYYNFHESPQGNPKSLNFVGNILKHGPAAQAYGLSAPSNLIFRPTTSGDFPNMFSGTVYEANNFAMNFSGVRGTPTSIYTSSPKVPMSVTPATANAALFDSILADVGPKPLDATSNRWISETKNGTGQYFNGAGFPPPNPFWQ